MTELPFGGGLANGRAERYEFLRGRDASLEVMEEVIALDALALDACYHVSAEDDRGLFRLNRESGLIVRDRATDRVIGYSMLLPVTPETCERVLSGRFVDTELTPDMVVRYDHPGIYDLYFASVVIHPAHRGIRLVLAMLDAMVRDFIDLADRGVFIRRMLADVVSDGGEKFCHLFGLDKVCDTDHGSAIYSVSGLPPKMRITTAATQHLFELYNTHFNLTETGGPTT